MSGIVHQFKILGAVVCAIAVLVMNNLFLGECSPKYLFHHNSMLGFVLSVLFETSVAAIVCAFALSPSSPLCITNGFTFPPSHVMQLAKTAPDSLTAAVRNCADLRLLNEIDGAGAMHSLIVKRTVPERFNISSITVRSKALSNRSLGEPGSLNSSVAPKSHIVLGAIPFAQMFMCTTAVNSTFLIHVT